MVCCDAIGRLTVNGTPLDEPTSTPPRCRRSATFDVVVPEGKLWVMGDNRNHSADSRAHTDPDGGFVDIADIEGKAAVIAWPLYRIRPSTTTRRLPERARPGRQSSRPDVPSEARHPRFRAPLPPAPGPGSLAGVDEVGRGALAGPVSVGIAVVDLLAAEAALRVRDSKLLSAAERERLEPLVRSWSVASAVGHASAARDRRRSASSPRCGWPGPAPGSRCWPPA